MEYVLLVRDKKLTPSLPCSILQGEHNATTLKIIVPIEHNSLYPTLQIILPNNTGKIKKCEYNTEVYKNNWLTITIPITSILTSIAGALQIWLTLFSVEGQEQTFKTEVGYIDVKEHKGFSEVTGDEEFQDIGQIVSELQVTVATLTDSKADTIVLDTETNTLSLKAGDTEISAISLPDEVVWEVME